MTEKGEGPPERTRETQREKMKDRRTDRERQGERDTERGTQTERERERGKAERERDRGSKKQGMRKSRGAVGRVPIYTYVYINLHAYNETEATDTSFLLKK